MENLRAAIEQDIEWYDKQANAMKSSKDVLALAVCIGAIKALRKTLKRLDAL